MSGLRNIWLSILFLTCCVFCSAQNDVAGAKIRAYNIYGFTKYISWPNQTLLSQFRIEVLGKDSLLLNELRLLSKTKTVEGLPITVINSFDVSKVGRPQILYVNNASGFDIEQVLRKVKGSNTLLIGEKFPFHTSMINFVQVNNEQKFEINQQLMSEEGFLVDSVLLRQAITSPEEWQKLYIDQGKILEIEKAKVEQQKEEISTLQSTQSELQKQIQQDRLRILRQKEDIRAQQKVLQDLLSESKDQDRALKNKIEQLKKREVELNAQEDSIERQDSLISGQKIAISGQQQILQTQSQQINDQNSVLEDQMSRIRLQRILLYLSVALSTLITILGFIAFRNYEAKKKANTILEEQKEAIEKQKTVIENKNTSITDSINYALRIQKAVLPTQQMAKTFFKDYFVLNLPKDIVSGDFFWVHQEADKLIVAVADCTGHGVPGAFMSIIGNSLLKEIIKHQKIFEPDMILDRLKSGVIDALNQREKGATAKDGMDIALCVIDKTKNNLSFSGAHNPLYILREKEIIEIKGDAQSIGHSIHHEEKFSKTDIDIKPNDRFYMFSDGFVDQKGGEKKKKYYYKNFKELLINTSPENLKEQGKLLEEEFLSWKGNFAQIDDVLVVGFGL
ncbi:MAG: YfiR/HmsC family protein [Flavobacteriales bacterium]|nr:YfiR/HmsC family protein [Flavobacteriales bacterium]